MRILLTGRTGQVGWELERALARLGEVFATDRAALDLADKDAIRSAVREAAPDVIVNAAAYTAVDRAESEPQVAMEINGTAPGVLALEARRCGALLIHYSTDYVFDGRSSVPYVEQDEPRPLNTYGRTKLAGEQAVSASGCRFLILRSSWIYAPRGKNFFLTIGRKALSGEVIRVIADQRGVPTESKFIAEMTAALIQRKFEGMLNVVPSGETTWHGFASAIVKAMHIEGVVQPILTTDYASPIRRPAYSVLGNKQLCQVLGRDLPLWDYLLERCIKEWNSSRASL